MTLYKCIHTSFANFCHVKITAHLLRIRQETIFILMLGKSFQAHECLKTQSGEENS